MTHTPEYMLSSEKYEKINRPKLTIFYDKLKSCAMNIFYNQQRVISKVSPQFCNVNIHATGGKIVVGTPYFF